MHPKQDLIPESEWHRRREEHRLAIAPITEAFRARRTRGEAHPVYDFLFTYYNFSTMKLERWHPGIGFTLECGGAEDPRVQELVANPLYVESARGIAIDPAQVRSPMLKQLFAARDLCTAVQNRPKRFSCFGLHEYAMVYRSENIRHPYPLRLSAEALAAFVESQTICCSHFDAFRFFTPKATPLNVLQPRSDTRLELEQGGCIHVNMDLYRWGYKLSPLISSELLRSCFTLAVAAREIDMKASPYDIISLGFEPIPVETPNGREIYIEEQRKLAVRADQLRVDLLREIERILSFLPNPVAEQTHTQELRLSS